MYAETIGYSTRTLEHSLLHPVSLSLSHDAEGETNYNYKKWVVDGNPFFIFPFYSSYFIILV